MECVICKMGTTYKGKTTYTIDKQKSLLVFRDVEADVCDNCGEAYFSLESNPSTKYILFSILARLYFANKNLCKRMKPPGNKCLRS